MALTEDRNTISRDGSVRTLLCAAGKKFYKGALVAVNSSGYATPGATATTIRGVGRCEDYKDNSSGSNGDLSVTVLTGVFLFDNSASADEITRASIGQDCYIVDDQTVAKTDGTGSRAVAGKVFDVDDNGVWVKF
ncbi:MAG: hypothetical protein HQK95_08830 [Nitrospirae bacterium]|nr:hypothetical protein [Nitrospirota bacterium]